MSLHEKTSDPLINSDPQTRGFISRQHVLVHTLFIPIDSLRESETFTDTAVLCHRRGTKDF